MGFADLVGMAELPRAVAIAVRYAPSAITDPDNMPNPAFALEYQRLDVRLTQIARRIARRLEEAGHRTIADPAPRSDTDRTNLIAPFQHKTAATRSGLGWIGKCALLVTEELGPGVRLATVLTDAPLVVGDPITKSRCGDCSSCVEACPGGAVNGESWYPGRPREEFYDAAACRRTCRERERARGITRGGCGVCMAVCPRRLGD